MNKLEVGKHYIIGDSSYYRHVLATAPSILPDGVEILSGPFDSRRMAWAVFLKRKQNESRSKKAVQNRV